MSFKMVLTDNSLFKTAFESISTIVDEVSCIIDSEGFRINSMDRSHIAFCSLNLKPELFDEFESTVPAKVTLDSVELLKVLKRMKSKDVLTLMDDEGNFIIRLSGDVDREFRIRIIDAEYETPEPPVIEYPVGITMPSDLIKDAITDMELFSERLDVIIDGDYFKLISNGDFGDGEVKYLHGEDVNECVQACFSIDKLKNFFKASKFSDTVEIFLGNDMPITINFKLISDDGELKYLLAPRLNEE